MIRRNQHILTQIYALCDFVMILLSFLLSWWVKFQSGWVASDAPLPIQTYFVWVCVYGGITVAIGFFMNFYTPKRKKRFTFEALKIIQIHFIGLFVLLSMMYLFKEIHISREFLAIFVFSNVLLLGTYRYVVKVSLRKLREKGYNKQFVLILGAGTLGKRFYYNLLQHPDLGFLVLGFLDDYQTEHDDPNLKACPIMGRVEELENILGTVMIDEVVIALPLTAHEKYGQIISICEKAGVRTMIIPDFYDFLPAKPYFDYFAGMPLISIRDIPLDDLGNRILKRSFDIVFALAAIIVTAPIMLLTALAIKCTSPGPVIFKQERVGFNRRTFNMYKFRTMRVLSRDVSNTQWTVPNDPRRTVLGTFLRKTSLDELPQFFNVLLGHMSVVGPRPERPYFVEQFKEEIPKYMVKHHIRPGITGWAQSNGLRGDTSIEDRIQYDIFYIENWTLLFDIKIIWRTIINGFINKNAY